MEASTFSCNNPTKVGSATSVTVAPLPAAAGNAKDVTGPGGGAALAPLTIGIIVGVTTVLCIGLGLGVGLGVGLRNAGSTSAAATPSPTMTMTPSASPLPEAFAQTALGSVQGFVSASARIFLGIPYARPPVGALRWQAPQPVAAWGALNATTEAPGCPQYCTTPRSCPTVTSENCLFLNVYAPRAAVRAASAPVLVYIHGGSFISGTSGGTQTSVLYDGQAIVNTTGSIVVTLNYRLGLLGFLYTGSSFVGNFGIMDQELALRWVQANIAAFGGDPTRVVLVGQSAGAMSVATHLSRPSTAGLYAAAVLQSEPFGLPFRNPTSAIALAAQAAFTSGCANASAPVSSINWTATEACLATLSTSAIINTQLYLLTHLSTFSTLIQTFNPFCPTVGTTFLPSQPLAYFQAANVVDVPVIFGNTRDESPSFVYQSFTSSVPQATYQGLVFTLFGASYAGSVFAQYPVSSPAPADFRPAMSTIITDGLFVCAVRNVTASLANAKTAGLRQSSSYYYLFDYVMAFTPELMGQPPSLCGPGAYVCHGDDLPQVWHPNYPQYNFTYTTAEDALSASMETYWTNLARGAPGTGWAGAPLSWPAYSLPARSSLRFQAPTTFVEAAYKNATCDFWDTQVGFGTY